MSHENGSSREIVSTSDKNSLMDSRSLELTTSSENRTVSKKHPETFRIKPILWDFKDYALSQNYCFSSCSGEELHRGIDRVLRTEDVEFDIDERLSLGYICAKILNFDVCRFTIIVSSLPESCKKTLGDNYIVEIFRDAEGDCDPLMWTRLVRKLFAELGEVVHECHPDLQDSFPLYSVFADDLKPLF